VLTPQRRIPARSAGSRPDGAILFFHGAR
jgi:hypothetical protein